MANNRIFYACQAVAIAGLPVETFVEVHGVQSVGINTNFNLEQAFELGQIQIYENIEGLPDVEVTLEKVLDGYPLIYHLASPDVNNGFASDASLVSRTKPRCSVAMAIYPDNQDYIDGTPPVQVYMSGMYVNSLSYSIPTDGNCTESVTLVGNHKEWLINSNSKFSSSLTNFDGTDEPQAKTDSNGGIQRRENVVMSQCVFPKSIYGVLDSTSAGNNWDSSLLLPRAHIQSVSISTDLARDDLLELGRKAPYYRAPNYPVEVTCEIEVIAISGDFVSAYETGKPAFNNTPDEGNNTTEEVIFIQLQDTTVFNLGSKNRLSSITYGGGDAGGGNATITYSYSTFNDLIVSQQYDPAAF
jgi:hypothetical protein